MNCQLQQRIKVRFPPISALGVDRRACFAFIRRVEGKLVNISVFVDVRMATFGINTNETTI